MRPRLIVAVCLGWHAVSTFACSWGGISEQSVGAVAPTREAAIYAALASLFLILFWSSVPVLLAWRFMQPRRIAWWAVISLSAVLGWLLLNAWAYFDVLHAHSLVVPAVGEPAPPELSYLWQCADEGDPQQFALILGWLAGIAYLIPCGLVYGIAHLYRQFRSRSAA